MVIETLQKYSIKRRGIKLAAITNHNQKELKEGIIHIHKMLELRKLRTIHQKTGKTCINCDSYCHDQNIQKQTINLTNKHQN